MPLIVSVQKEVEYEHMPCTSDLIAWAEATQQDSDQNIELNIRVVSKEEIRNLNKVYRGQDKETNVLSFTSSVATGISEIPVLADVIICADLVVAEAKEFNKPLQDRWAHMVVHGCLHVQGFDHEEENERAFMEAEERKILGKLQFSDPYQA